MQVGKLGHAGVVVMEGDTTCMMDAVLYNVFESGSNRMAPTLTVDIEACRRACSVLVLSHAHMDHFCIRSLNAFDRSTPVIFPEGEKLIAYALERLGFTEVKALAQNEKVTLGALELFPSASLAPFPEMGMLFRNKHHTFWNVVDSVIDEGIIAQTRAWSSDIDLLFTKFQPLIETELTLNGLGSDFPVEKYASFLTNVWDIDPRYVSPASCGYQYTRAEWLNRRGFPINEVQFAADLAAQATRTQALHVPHGGLVEVGETCHLLDGGLPFAQGTGEVFAGFDWRPDLGVPPLTDTNAFGYDLADIKQTVDQYLNGTFLDALGKEPSSWLKRMHRLGVVWRLEVIHPNETVVRHLDFGSGELVWKNLPSSTFVKLHTSVTASAVVALLRGDCNAYTLTFNSIRMFERIYSITRDGHARIGSAADEPISRVLLRDADERYVEAELKKVLGA